MGWAPPCHLGCGSGGRAAGSRARGAFRAASRLTRKLCTLRFLKPAAPTPRLLWHRVPAVAGVAHRFHSTCGKNVALEEDGTRAVRAAGYAHGLVFSTKELRAEEVFEVGAGPSAAGPGCCPSSRPAPMAAAVLSRPQVKVQELDERWAGSLRLGLTTLAPGETGPGAGGGPGLPPSLPELRTKTTWMVSSCEVRRDGQLQRMNYGRDLERLGVKPRAPRPGVGGSGGAGDMARGSVLVSPRS